MTNDEHIKRSEFIFCTTWIESANVFSTHTTIQIKVETTWYAFRCAHTHTHPCQRAQDLTINGWIGGTGGG